MTMEEVKERKKCRKCERCKHKIVSTQHKFAFFYAYRKILQILEDIFDPGTSGARRRMPSSLLALATSIGTNLSSYKFCG
jgi:hypothetical protein